MSKHTKTTYLILLLFIFLGCKSEKKEETSRDKALAKITYNLEPVNIRNVKMTDNFWLPIIKRVQEKTIAYAIQKCKEEGRFDNFLIAGGKKDGDVHGVMPFDDTDVYKIIEGASNSIISAPNKNLEKLLDSLISIIEVGQEKDGYLTTWRTINPAKPPATWVEVDEGKRWESLSMSHELYNAGHLFEAAVVHYKATGKRNFLNIAIKNADLIVKTFGDVDGQIKTVPGHQIIESGLIKLYEVTENENYLNLAKYFLDHRGNSNHHTLFNEYAQDHLPVIEQKEVVGHAVRAVYMYAAMTDIAALQNDSLYINSVHNLWNNMVDKKMYVTGGIGAKHEGEAFGDNYELPNLTAYNETCASIGDVYWNHRLHNLSGEVKYFDVIERTLYNGLISGLSLDGTHFFYPNALESDGIYKFNRGSCTRQAWFDCSCCPTNVIRFIPSVPGLLYSKKKDTVYVNLYASNNAKIELTKNTLEISQKTQYPWNGKVVFTINQDKVLKATLKFRIPGWNRNEVLPSTLYTYSDNLNTAASIKVNGKNVASSSNNDGYFTITNLWEKGDVITLNLPMKIRKVVSDKNIIENKNKVALEYGPLVYAIEEIDNPANFDEITISPSDTFQINQRDILGGINTISNANLTAIPYYTWSNRGVGKMKVWIDNDTAKN